jgi:hypothetical protein
MRRPDLANRSFIESSEGLRIKVDERQAQAPGEGRTHGRLPDRPHADEQDRSRRRGLHGWRAFWLAPGISR